jgi:probable RNA-binding protein EIF1AD
MGRGKFINSKLDEMPEPSANQSVVVVLGTPGGNLLQVADASGRSFLCRVPTIFRGKVWAIKGGYLLVDKAEGDSDGGAVGKVQATLAQHLYRDQIRHLQSRGLWPSGFDVKEEKAPVATQDAAFARGNDYLGEDEYGDLPANRNRRGGLRAQDDDEEEEMEDQEEEEEEEEEAYGREPGAAAGADANDEKKAAVLSSACGIASGKPEPSVSAASTLNEDVVAGVSDVPQPQHHQPPPPALPVVVPGELEIA